MDEYTIEFVLLGQNIDIDKLTKTLTEIGRSVTVNQEEKEKIKIHLNAADPRKVFDRTSRFGKPTFIKIDDSSSKDSQENLGG
jgi:dihydroxyacetone kinase-like predicted kinase